MRNYDFEINIEKRNITLHMMDRSEKYLNKIGVPVLGELPHVQIHAPEGFPQEMISFLENAVQNRFASEYKPKEGLKGVISIKCIDAYTITFDISKLWFDQCLDEVRTNIIQMMGLEEEYVDLDWAKDQIDFNQQSSDEE